MNLKLAPPPSNEWLQRVDQRPILRGEEERLAAQVAEFADEEESEGGDQPLPKQGSYKLCAFEALFTQIHLSKYFEH